MKNNHISGIAMLGLLALSACSTSKLAQQSTNNTDDVYYTEVKAKEQPAAPPVQSQPTYRTDEQLYGGNDYAYDDHTYTDSGGYYSKYYDDYDYTERIDHFYYNRPYDSWYYRYDPWFDGYYGLNSWYYQPGFSFSLGFGSPWLYNDYYYGYYGYPYSYYGYPYTGRYWGPYSYYSYYPGYGYGYGGVVRTDPNYRPRPNRETRVNRSTPGYNPGLRGGTSVSGTTDMSSMGRPQRVSRPADNNSRGNTVSSRPEQSSAPQSRPQAQPQQPSRPSRTQQRQQERPTYTPPRQQSRPTEYSRPQRSSSPSSSSGGSYGGGSSRSSGGGGGRPSRR